MNRDFTATEQQIELLKRYNAILSNLLHTLPSQRKEGWDKAMTKNLTAMMKIYDRICCQQNELMILDAKGGHFDKEVKIVMKEDVDHADHAFALRLDAKAFSLIVSTLQLATRHPIFCQQQSCKKVGQIIDAMIAMIPETMPAYRAMLEQGNNHPQAPDKI